MKQGGTTESQVKGEIHEGMTNNEKHRSPEFLENGNVGVRSFRKMETSEFRSFPEMENIGNSGVSGNRITSKYTYLGNSPEFRVVLEPWERILTRSTYFSLFSAFSYEKSGKRPGKVIFPIPDAMDYGACYWLPWIPSQATIKPIPESGSSNKTRCQYKHSCCYVPGL